MGEGPTQHHARPRPASSRNVSRVVLLRQDAAVARAPSRDTITMGDAESELGFDYFALGTDKFAGSPSRYNSRLIEGELQRRLHKLKMGYERGWRHPDMGAVCAPPPVPAAPSPSRSATRASIRL